MTEFHDKQRHIQALLESSNLDALLLRRVSNFAWATCGAASCVNTAVSEGLSQLLITKSRRFLITDNIEAARLMREEKLDEQRWEIIAPQWDHTNDSLEPLIQGLTIGSDSPLPGSVDLSKVIARMRSNLTMSEVKRFRRLGRLCAQAMEATLDAVRPRQSEYRIAAKLAHETGKRGVQAIVNLVATDERIFSFRHPLPTDKKLERYAMLGLCGRKWGLVCSLTRFLHFGRIPEDLSHRAEAVAKVDAAFIANTQPGQELGDIFKRGIEIYTESGYPAEWRLHHQGGLAGYEPREIVATPCSQEIVSAGQVYAWNPSITGTKSEDTILVTENGYEILTHMSDWPSIPVEFDRQTFLRPAILERR
ncbi:MAG TPA: M24 family metallopeptidase [Anaerolineales bacterium]|nr:M24 family metallopeptidase [Anaerolineales bacterium]HLO29047.1 M24 family metallopeptidase [Anaerolineales bacterium]